MEYTKNSSFRAKDIAYIAVMTALLIGGQYVLSFTYGLEVVTVLLLSFSYAFGVRRGMLAATAFSLLRNFVFGFFPTVLILYLVYYNLFALVCGLCGKVKGERGQTICFYAIFALVACVCVYYLIFPPAISVLKRGFVQTMFIVILSLSTVALLAYMATIVLKTPLKKSKLSAFDVRKTLFMTAIACICTIGFSLLDDVITPLFFSYSKDATLAYFYGSFLAMLPQTTCAFATVVTLFFPLTKIFAMFQKSFDKRN